MELTPEIIEAIRRKNEELGAKAFSAQVGIGPQTIYKYISGMIKTVHPRTWARLYPLIREHLPGEDGELLQIGNIVRLKSGGPPMTVEMINGPITGCVWFLDGQRLSSFFHADTFRKTTPED